MSPRPASTPSTLISSSSSSQCNPVPPPLISKQTRCFGVARFSRGKNESGTASWRPSVSSSHMLEASNQTRTAAGLSVEVLVPRATDKLLVFINHPFQTK